MRKFPVLLSASCVIIFSSCGDTGNKSAEKKVNSDTIYSGLEGTRDQSGQLSTDAKQDTSGGQAKTEKLTGTDSSNKSTASNGDSEFFKQQVEGNYDELSLVKLASTKSSDNEIKSIARNLVDDHSKALDKLREMSKKEMVTVTSGPSDNAMKMAESLGNKKANQFDKAWCETLIEQHKKTIAIYEAAAKTVTNRDLKSFINETLPKLRMHLDKLMAYHGQVKS